MGHFALIEGPSIFGLTGWACDLVFDLVDTFPLRNAQFIEIELTKTVVYDCHHWVLFTDSRLNRLWNGESNGKMKPLPTCLGRT